jgi:carbamoylphosphate synthase large subunit
MTEIDRMKQALRKKKMTQKQRDSLRANLIAFRPRIESLVQEAKDGGRLKEAKTKIAVEYLTKIIDNTVIARTVFDDEPGYEDVVQMHQDFLDFLIEQRSAIDENTLN